MTLCKPVSCLGEMKCAKDVDCHSCHIPLTDSLGRPSIHDHKYESLIREESENDTFRLPWSKKSRLDFLRPYQDSQMTHSCGHGLLRCREIEVYL